MAKYLTNQNMVAEIHKSKMTYCWSEHPDYEKYDYIVDTLEDIPQNIIDENPVIRLMTFQHIPLNPSWAASKIKKKVADGYMPVNFPPFIHVKFQDGEYQTVLKSHYIDENTFSTSHGYITDRLGRMYMLMVEKIGQKSNWRNYSFLDDMKCEAICVLMNVGLRFDEWRYFSLKKGVIRKEQQNAFAFTTTCVYNVFKRMLNQEKSRRELRDDLLEKSGCAPSMDRQVNREMEAISRQLSFYQSTSKNKE